MTKYSYFSDDKRIDEQVLRQAYQHPFVDIGDDERIDGQLRLLAVRV